MSEHFDEKTQVAGLKKTSHGTQNPFDALTRVAIRKPTDLGPELTPEEPEYVRKSPRTVIVAIVIILLVLMLGRFLLDDEAPSASQQPQRSSQISASSQTPPAAEVPIPATTSGEPSALTGALSKSDFLRELHVRQDQARARARSGN